MPYQDLTETLSPEHRARLLEIIKPGEDVLWTGKPVSGSGGRRSWIGALIGLVWIGLIVWIFFIQPEPPPWFMSIPFLGVGCVFINIPFRRRRKEQSKVYILTKDQAIVFDGKNLRSLFITRDIRLQVTERQHGTGDILFDHPQDQKPEGHDVRDHPRRFRASRFGFKRIAAVKTIEQLIRDAQS